MWLVCTVSNHRTWITEIWSYFEYSINIAATLKLSQYCHCSKYHIKCTWTKVHTYYIRHIFSAANIISGATCIRPNFDKSNSGVKQYKIHKLTRSCTRALFFNGLAEKNDKKYVCFSKYFLMKWLTALNSVLLQKLIARWGT